MISAGLWSPSCAHQKESTGGSLVIGTRVLLNADEVVPHAPAETYSVFLDSFKMIMQSDLGSCLERYIFEMYLIPHMFW